MSIPYMVIIAVGGDFNHQREDSNFVHVIDSSLDSEDTILLITLHFPFTFHRFLVMKCTMT